MDLLGDSWLTSRSLWISRARKEGKCGKKKWGAASLLFSLILAKESSRPTIRKGIVRGENDLWHYLPTSSPTSLSNRRKDHFQFIILHREPILIRYHVLCSKSNRKRDGWRLVKPSTIARYCQIYFWRFYTNELGTFPQCSSHSYSSQRGACSHEIWNWTLSLWLWIKIV